MFIFTYRMDLMQQYLEWFSQVLQSMPRIIQCIFISFIMDDNTIIDRHRNILSYFFLLSFHCIAAPKRVHNVLCKRQDLEHMNSSLFRGQWGSVHTCNPM
jgi:hypothetical protein